MRMMFLLMCLLVSFSSKSQNYTPTYFQEKELKEDLKFLKEKVKKIHPKFLDKKNCLKWENQYSKIYSKLNESLTFNESYIIFSSLLSILKDGHSNFSFPYSERVKYMKNGGVTMPFTIKIRGGKIYFDKYFSKINRENIIGSEITSINGISAKTILLDLNIFYGAKNHAIINNNIEKYFGAYFWTFYGEFDTCNIEIKRNNNKQSVLLQPISNDEYFQLKRVLYPKKEEKKYELRFFENQDFAYLKVKTFADKEKLSIYLNNFFDTIKMKGVQNLLIDIRNNFGGTSDCVDSLLSYLTVNKYKQYKSIKLRISDTIKAKYKVRNVDIYNSIKKANQLFSYPDSLLIKKPVSRENMFTGNVYVLINENTYSAASTFAGVVKRNKLGKIVGATETGGTIEYYGDFLFYELPNTKMKFFISPKVFIQYGGRELNGGVCPNIKMKKEDDILRIFERITNDVDL